MARHNKDPRRKPIANLPDARSKCQFSQKSRTASMPPDRRAAKVWSAPGRYSHSGCTVIEDATTFRSKEQVLYDLSKALPFSPESLQANRAGKISKEQKNQLSGRCIPPAVLTLVLAVAPFIIWTWITAGRQQLSLTDAFPALFKELTHVKDLLEAHGKMGGVVMLGSILGSLVMSVFMATRIPLQLYFDLLDGKVEAREGRVVAREEQENRPNGRDPIEKYFFSLRYLNMPVNLAAYRALEAGSVYIVYLFPRSEVLASIEPKMDGSGIPVASDQKSSPAHSQQ
jgi:hypothetical protein